MDHNFTPRLHHTPSLFARQFAKLPFQALKLSRMLKPPKNNFIRTKNISRPYGVIKKKETHHALLVEGLVQLLLETSHACRHLEGLGASERQEWLYQRASGTCAVELDEVQQLQYFSTVRSDMRIMASLAALHSSSWGAGEGHRKAMFHK